MERNIKFLFFSPQFYKNLVRTWKQSANGGKDVI